MFIVTDKKEVNIETGRILWEIQGNSSWSWPKLGLDKAGAREGLAVCVYWPLTGQSALEEHVTKGKGKSGRENCPWLFFPTSCSSLSALSACHLQCGVEMVLIPHELEITFEINNLQEIGCSLKSNWDVDRNAFDKHYWIVAILHLCAHAHTHTPENVPWIKLWALWKCVSNDKVTVKQFAMLVTARSW